MNKCIFTAGLFLVAAYYMHAMDEQAEQASAQLQNNAAAPLNQRYSCPVPNCLVGFYNKSHLRFHMEGHQEGREHKCNECLWGSKTLGGLKLHKIKMHEKRAASAAAFVGNTNGEPHRQLAARRRRIREFTCPTAGCVYRTAVRINLERHLIGQQPGRPFKCGQCCWASKDQFALNAHTRRTHRVDFEIQSKEAEAVVMNRYTTRKRKREEGSQDAGLNAYYQAVRGRIEAQPLSRWARMTPLKAHECDACYQCFGLTLEHVSDFAQEGFLKSLAIGGKTPN